MNTFLKNLGMGVSLASLSFTSAFGAVVPARRDPVPAQPAAVASTASSIAADTPVAVARDDLTGGLRPARYGDNSWGIMTWADFHKKYPAYTEESFREIQKENKESCADTGAMVREALSIADEAKVIDGELIDLGPILARLGARQNAAAGFQGVAQVVSTGLLCALSAGLYCAAAAAAGAGNLGNTAAYWNTQRVDRKMRDVNLRQSRLQIRATLLTMRANIMWANTMQDYCLQVFPNTTLGVGRVNPMAVYGTTNQVPPARRDNNLLPSGFGRQN